ncbi:MAG: hypothetical protein ACKO81_11010 [Planctomycetota bacterium]
MNKKRFHPSSVLFALSFLATVLLSSPASVRGQVAGDRLELEEILTHYNEAKSLPKYEAANLELAQYLTRLNPIDAFEKVVNIKERDVSIAAYWLLTLEEIQDNRRSNRTKSKSFDYAKCFGRFYGFVSFAVGSQPDGAWQSALEHGELPENFEEGPYSGTLVRSEKTHQELRGLNFEVSDSGASSCLEISLLNDEKERKWTLEVPPFYKPPAPVVGAECYHTRWFEITSTKSPSEACFWGASDTNINYFVVFSIESGELIDQVYIRHPDRVFLRKLK